MTYSLTDNGNDTWDVRMDQQLLSRLFVQIVVGTDTLVLSMHMLLGDEVTVDAKQLIDAAYRRRYPGRTVVWRN